MSTVRSIPKAEWKEFFDRLSGGLLGRRAEIEVAGLDLGDQIIAEWIPMIGITYDSQDDLLDVALDRSDHLIRGPKQILIEEGSSGVKGIAVVDSDGTRQFVKLKEPVLLPA